MVVFLTRSCPVSGAVPELVPGIRSWLHDESHPDTSPRHGPAGNWAWESIRWYRNQPGKPRPSPGSGFKWVVPQKNVPCGNIKWFCHPPWLCEIYAPLPNRKSLMNPRVAGSARSVPFRGWHPGVVASREAHSSAMCTGSAYQEPSITVWQSVPAVRRRRASSCHGTLSQRVFLLHGRSCGQR